MLRFFFRNNNEQIKFLCLQSSHFYSTKGPKDENLCRAKSVTVQQDNIATKITKFIKRDIALTKSKLTFWKPPKNDHLDKTTGRIINWEHPLSPPFPSYCDVVIIGGGAIGSSVAYWLKRLAKQTLEIVVVEKDPTYKQASTVLSVGGLRQQFSLPENIEMSLFGAEFIRDVNEYLGIEGEPPIDLNFHPYGYLSLATEKTAEILKNNSALQNSLGAKNVLLTANQLKSKFPWLNTDGIELGCLGVEKEGWFDPWSLLCALKRKAISMGVTYVTADVIGFNFRKQSGTLVTGNYDSRDQIEYLAVQTEDGKQRSINFSHCVIAAGAFSGEIAKMAQIGTDSPIDVLRVPLPVEPRKRYVYCFHSPDGPGLNTPMTIDPSGVYFRREGLNNNYICGLSPEESEEPSIDNLEVDHEYFNEKIWPKLANRVKAFENLKVCSSWAGYYEYNTFDENGVIGHHPYHPNIMFATGFSGHGIQKAPAVGRAISELIKYSQFKTINLNRLCFDRFINSEPLREINIW